MLALPSPGPTFTRPPDLKPTEAMWAWWDYEDDKLVMIGWVRGPGDTFKNAK